jgi:hypothetical protein
MLTATPTTYVFGDIHGYADRMADRLREVGLVDGDAQWIGGQAALWFLGDFCDRGPDGIGAVELVMRLQPQAAAAGGQVGAVLGNHDVTLLSAWRFGDYPLGTLGGRTFVSEWKRNGGQDSDLERLTPAHADWLLNLPAMVRVGSRLLVHADSRLYLDYGDSVEAVNTAFAHLLRSHDPEAWDRLLSQFSEHRGFMGVFGQGLRRAAAFLQTYGGQQIVHGHTPLPVILAEAPERIHAPHIYADNLCVNVDPGMYLGGPGFVYTLPPLHETVSVI